MRQLTQRENDDPFVDGRCREQFVAEDVLPLGVRRLVPVEKVFVKILTVTIWIPDSSEYWTVGVSGIQVVNSRDLGPFKYRTFWTIKTFFNMIFRTPFEYLTVQQPNTNLPFEYQTSLVRW